MVKQHSIMLDRVYELDAAGFLIKVKVMDVKQSYGVTRVQVEPIHGEGIHWVALDRLRELQ